MYVNSILTLSNKILGGIVQTKEEQIKSLVRLQKVIEQQYNNALTLANRLKESKIRIVQRINWLSHLIRKGE